MAIVAAVALILRIGCYVRQAMFLGTPNWFVTLRLLNEQVVLKMPFASVFLKHVHGVDINDILHVIFVGNRETFDRFSNRATQVGGVGGLQ